MLSDFWLGMIFTGIMAAVVIYFVILVGTDIIRRQKEIKSRLRMLETLVRSMQQKQEEEK